MLSTGLAVFLLIGSLGVHHERYPELVEGGHPAPAGSSIALEVISESEDALVVGQKATFKFSANYVLNADHGKIKLIMQTTPDECSWRVMTIDVRRGSGKALTGISFGYEKLPNTVSIRFVALLAEMNQSDTSTKAVIALPVAMPDKPLSALEPSSCKS